MTNDERFDFGYLLRILARADLGHLITTLDRLGTAWTF